MSSSNSFSTANNFRSRFKKTVLENGVRVLTEHHPQSRSVSCGIWVTRGTRDEATDEAGLAHFVEHLVFKRTKKRNAFEISRDMEAVGGDLNAYTSREYTCYVTHSLKEDLGLSLDVLADLVCAPSFEAKDIEKEKQVVEQEIHMAEDQLEENIFDRYFEKSFRSNPLGRPILGTVRSIRAMKRSQIRNFHSRLYRPQNIIVSVAGHVDHQEVLRLVQRTLRFKKEKSSHDFGELSERDSGANSQPGIEPLSEPFREVIRRPSEQAHLLFGFPSSSFRSPYRFEPFVVNCLLGGGMTSRLYQSVREQKGLVYSIYSQLATFFDTGLMVVYAATDAKKAPTVIEMIIKEIRRIKKHGLKKKDLDFFKRQVRGQILLGADDVETRMNSVAIGDMVGGRYRSVDDIIGEVQKVTLAGVHEYIETYFDLDRLGILAMGPLPEKPTRRWLESI